LVSVGTSPFLGAAQFGRNARIYRKKFMNHPDEVLKILEASYEFGGRGIELVPAGKIIDAAKIMKETHEDFTITGSTFPGPDPMINELVNIGAKIIFVHGIASDKKDSKLLNLVEDAQSTGVIVGLAVHNPINTLEFAFENLPEVKTFLIPFNSNGLFMGNKPKLEKIVNNNVNCHFIGMKTLAAGKINPEKAYKYISSHNIKAVTIGMVSVEEAKESTKIALKFLKK
jgi:hypothetical protein